MEIHRLHDRAEQLAADLGQLERRRDKLVADHHADLQQLTEEITQLSEALAEIKEFLAWRESKPRSK